MMFVLTAMGDEERLGSYNLIFLSLHTVAHFLPSELHAKQNIYNKV